MKIDNIIIINVFRNNFFEQLDKPIYLCLLNVLILEQIMVVFKLYFYSNFAIKINIIVPLSIKDFIGLKFYVLPNPANDFVNVSNIKITNLKG